MVTKARTGALAVVIAGVVMLSTACYVYLPPVGSGTTCPEGTHALQHAEVTEALSTPYGTVTVSIDPSSVSLTMANGSWTLSGAETLTITGSTIAGPLTGTAEVDGTASGSYVISGSDVTFTLGSVSGSVSFAGTIGGMPFSFDADLSDLGDLSSLYGLSGTVPFSCDGAGGLTLTFPDFTYQF